jgi:16S rRNA (cytidine1402-2'-O)-methyltransferase
MSRLYLVPTPIGNLADMTYRSVEILKAVHVVLAEDTRTSSKLLRHYEISTPMRAFHQHNEHKVLDRVLDEIASGVEMALISDAGTPGISDPGFLLVRACVERDIPVESLPGATAVIPALVLSGLPLDRFVFEGFLPHKKGRQTRIKAIAIEERTTVMYESPHRIVKLLKELITFCGETRRISVSRELTKRFEETVRGTLPEVLAHFEANEPRGEFVVVFEGVV